MSSGRTRLVALGLVVAVLVGFGAVASAQGQRMTPVLIGFNGPADASAVTRAGGTVTHQYRLVPAVAATVPEQAIGGLQHNPKVAYVEPDRIVRAVDYLAGEAVPWGITKIGAPAVYTAGNAGTGVKVAVLDTGIDASHPEWVWGELGHTVTNYAGGYDFVRGDSVPDDENGHGTHVSGTIAAADNGVGVPGAGPQVSLYALKFLGKTGSGSTSDEVAGIEWAMSHEIKVLNMSFGSYSSSLTEQAALDKAYAQGMLLVAACGNDGNATILYPAAYSSVIAVAATDANDKRASFSSYYADVELAAPGVGVYSSMPGYRVYLNLMGYPRNYASLSGTSMATPHVSGAAALVFRQHPDWSNVQVRDQLDGTVTDLGAAGRDSYFGFGLVNAEAACAGTTPPPPPDPLTGTITGTVYRSDQWVAKATVSLVNQAGTAIASTATDGNGSYTFVDVPAPVDYTVTAKYRKYKDAVALHFEGGPDPVVIDLHLQ